MVNFHDPAVETLDNFILLKFWHVVDGLYIWEFFTTLYFEWNFIQGRRRYRWTIWIYSLSRVAALAAVIVNLVLLNLNSPVNCELAVILEMVPAYLALAAASFLIVIRTVAIWNKDTVVVAISSMIWGINSAFFIQGISRFHYASEAPGTPCQALNIQSTKVTMVVAFVTDTLLLIIMLVGLRQDHHRNGALATGRFLWDQGVIWLLIATVAGVLPTVFVCINLNAPLSVIFHIPWLLTMPVAATRMYRGLDDFKSSDILNVSSHQGGHLTLVSGTRDTPARPIPLPRIDVEVPTVHDDSLMSQVVGNMDTRLHDKSHEMV